MTAALERVLIIGGGIGGLAAAVALRRAGMEARVFERAARPAAIGGGIQLRANGIRALQALDLAEAAQAVGTSIDRFQFFSWRGTLLVDVPLNMPGPAISPPLLGITRPALLEVLSSGLAPMVLELGASCASVQQDQDAVTVRLDEGRDE